ncbi:hypothetical protein BST95_10285 [Halioglobus japonicus]|nr:hypothetical protein BST95_10285 [Halioglobus japonicus]
MTVTSMPALPKNLAVGIRELQELLDQKMVEPAFQPIVACIEGNPIHAYEILGRGTHERLSPFPGPLFYIAESISGLALQSSHLFHICGLEIASGLQANAPFFINIHPDELRNIPDLLAQCLSQPRNRARDSRESGVRHRPDETPAGRASPARHRPRLRRFRCRPGASNGTHRGPGRLSEV